MSLLVSEEFSEKLNVAISNATESIIFVSAFITTPAIDFLKKNINDQLNVKIISRWKKHDLLSGASNMRVYESCVEHGWKFGIDQDLHGKLYLVDNLEIFLGSANLTQKGLNLHGYGNHEFGTNIKAENTDLDKLHEFINREVTWLDNNIYEKLKIEVESSMLKKEPVGSSSWSTEITLLLEHKVEYLWVHELLFGDVESLLQLDLGNEDSVHDFGLLNLNIDELDSFFLKRSFKQTRLYSWLYCLLKEQKEMKFGAVSQVLHNALLNDPRPYRKEVKDFVVNIFSWVNFLSEEIIVVKHNHTSSLKFIN